MGKAREFWPIIVVFFVLFLIEYLLSRFHLNNQALIVLGAAAFFVVLPNLTEFKFLGIEGKLREFMKSIDQLENEIRTSVRSLYGLGVDNRARRAILDQLRRLAADLESRQSSISIREPNAMGMVAKSILELVEAKNERYALDNLPGLRVRIPETHYILAIAYRRRGDLERAQSHLETMVTWGESMNDGRIQALGLMGKALMIRTRSLSQRNFELHADEIMALYNRALERDAHCGLVYLNRAAMYCGKRDWNLCFNDLIAFGKVSGLTPREVLDHIEEDADKGFGGLDSLVLEQAGLEGASWKEKLIFALSKNGLSPTP